MHYQAVLLSDTSIIYPQDIDVNWWDHLDLNQESTNYEFAALTNYAIVPYSIISISLSVTTATLAPQGKSVFSFPE